MEVPRYLGTQVPRNPSSALPEFSSHLKESKEKEGHIMMVAFFVLDQPFT